MIELTDEMRTAAYRAAREWVVQHRHALPDDRMLDVALAAALRIVERDWNMQPRPDGSRLPSVACGARGFAVGPGCIRRAGHEGRHGYSDGSGEQDKP